MIQVSKSRMDAIGVGPGKQPSLDVSAGLPGDRVSKTPRSGPVLFGF